jgi:hypothetical protein
MLDFAYYWFATVIPWAFRRWCGGFGSVFFDVTLGLLTVVVGAFLQSRLASRWPSLNEELGRPMYNVYWYLIYVVAPAITIVMVGSFLAFCVIAPSQIHQEQQEEIAAVKAALSGATMPQFIGQIDTWAICQMNADVTSWTGEKPDPANKVGLFLTVSLINRGSPSVAYDFALAVKRADGKDFTTSKITAPNAVVRTVTQGTLNQSYEEYLDEKTAITPVPNGGRCVGYLFFALDKDFANSRADATGSILTLTFKDASGQKQTIAHTISDVESVGIGHIPGTRFEQGSRSEQAAPKFRAEILQLSRGTEQSTGLPNVFVWVTIRNTGAPSIADRWVLRAKSGDRVLIGHRKGLEPTSFEMPDGQWVNIDPADALYEKTTSQPVPTNSVIYGILRYEFREISRDELIKIGPSDFTLTFDDANDNTYTASNFLMRAGMARSIHFPA